MIGQLNDDCLCEIFRYLNVKDQLSLTAVSERFRGVIVERFWRLRFSKFTTKGDASCAELNITDFQIFYRLIAPCIRELTIHNTSSVAFTSYLGRYTKRPELDFYFHFEYPQLRVLRCYDERLHGGNLASLICKSPQLELLKLTSPDVSGEHLVNIQNLSELYVSSNKLEPKYFGEIFRNRKIKRLRLTGETTSKRHMETVLKAILPQMTELRYYDEEERLITQKFLPEWADMCKNLQLLFCKRLSGFVYSLRTLRELHFESHVELDDLLEIVDNNLHLEHLYLGLNFSVLSKSRDWVCELSDRVRVQERKKVLTIHLDWLQKSILQLQKFMEERDFQRDYLKPALKIRKLPIDSSQFPVLISKTGIEFALQWN